MLNPYAVLYEWTPVNFRFQIKAKGGDQMPGFNKRGPDGMGPMTGGGRGLCNPANRSFNRGRYSMAAGGRGRGSGFGRQQPRVFRRAGFGYAGAAYYDQDQEESILRNKETMLKDELEAIKRRLDKIEKTT